MHADTIFKLRPAMKLQGFADCDRSVGFAPFWLILTVRAVDSTPMPRYVRIS